MGVIGALFFGGVVGPGGAIEAIAVGDCEGGEAELGGLAEEFFGLGGAAVEGEGGAGVEFDEGHERWKFSRSNFQIDFKFQMMKSQTGWGDSDALFGIC